MSRKENSTFNVHINSFDGDPNYVKFFFVLLHESAKINKWTNEQTLLFLKSKLTGAALKYFLETPNLMLTDDITLIQNKFETFFCEKSNNSAFTEFNNLSLLPEESITHFSHRLNVITTNAYPDITDQNALNSIKLNKFLASLPTNLRIKLREEKVISFENAMCRAQELQQIFNSELQPKSNQNNYINAISTSLANLTDKVDALTQNNTNSRNNRTLREGDQEQDYAQNRHNYRNSYKSRNFSRSNRRFIGNRNVQPIVCQLCFKQGHKANTCVRYVQRRGPRQHPAHFRSRGNNNNYNNYNNRNFQRFNDQENLN
jgi:hypothetical protein